MDDPLLAAARGTNDFTDDGCIGAERAERAEQGLGAVRQGGNRIFPLRGGPRDHGTEHGERKQWPAKNCRGSSDSG